ncbi:ATP-binding protein [Candidatus Latescibacterota bacterium]
MIKQLSETKVFEVLPFHYIAVILGLVSITGAFIIGFIAYNFSFQLIESYHLKYYLEKANMIVNSVNLYDDPSDLFVLSAYETLWNQIENKPPDEYMCIVNKQSNLILHTAHPATIGTYVGDNRVINNATESTGILKNIVTFQMEYIGDYLSNSGDNQIAAFVPVPGKKWVLGIHRSKDILENEIKSTLRLLFVGFFIICGFLMPFSLLMLFITFNISQKKREITERQLKESEEKHHNLFDTMSQGVVYHNADGGIVSANKAAESILGLTLEQMQGKASVDPRWRTFHEDGSDFSDVTGPSLITLRTGKEERNEIMGVFKPETEEYKWINITAKPQFISGEENPSHFYTTLDDITDITERKQLEEQLQQAQRMESIGRLAGGIAHDFNNLLTTIIGNADLTLMSLSPDERIFEDINEIKKSADRATNLTRQLLAFSRNQVIEPKIINLNDLLLDMEKMLHRLIGENLDFVILPADGLWKINIDKGQSEQILTNLVINARDAMPNVGKLTIETANVTLSEEYARHHVGVIPGDYSMLAVNDTGIGMDDETISHIFEPFYTTKEKGKGTGLGLSTCYGIVKQNNGHIWVYSELGIGTTIKVFFPRALQEPAQTKEPEVLSDISRGTETVLIVEDDFSLRKIVARILRENGYSVIEASNGEDALNVVKKTVIDIIHLLMTDVVMPKMGGMELSQHINEIYPDIRVLYMSGYTDKTIIHRGVLQPDHAFIQKPFSLSDMITKVRTVLDE